MIARGFKPVGWVAAVATAALGCYMLSLNVAAERSELSDVERQIMLTKREIRALQTELGTRGRLQQLEHWNADVLALSAPGSAQFLNDEFRLASYSEPQKSFEDRAKVRMASAETLPSQAAPAIERDFAAAPSALDKPVVRRASLVVGEAAPFKSVNSAPAKAPVVKQPVPKAPLVKVAEAKPVAKASTKAPTKVAAKAPAKPTKAAAKSLIPSDLEREIAQASKAEKSSGGASGR
jgi:hypothetical protein